MDEIEIAVLEAAAEYRLRQWEMLPQLAAAVGVSDGRVFYSWAAAQFAQRGKLADADWAYFFHGLECDLTNQRDGRFLRMDFGPKGRVGILNDFGVLRLILTSVTPWAEFPTLRSHFKKAGPPFDENSGDWLKFSQAWDRLEEQGFFEMADKNLVELQAKFTSRGLDGLSYVRFPPEISEDLQADCSVAHRQRLSEKAIQLLQDRASTSAAKVLTV